MKICWDTLEKIEYRPDRKQWKDKRYSNIFYIYKDACKNCEEPYLTIINCKNKGLFCSKSCSQTGENNTAKSTETRLKMSLSKTGSKNPYFGKKRPEHSIKMSGENHPMWGKHHTKESREKISMKITKLFENPENHPNWLGGVSDNPYCSGWKQLAQELKECDDNECQNPLCRGISNNMTSHHIDYDKKNCKPINVITLCISCNARANFNRDFWQEFYTKLKRLP